MPGRETIRSPYHIRALSLISKTSDLKLGGKVDQPDTQADTRFAPKRPMYCSPVLPMGK
jgi:hypothetical protein